MKKVNRATRYIGFVLVSMALGIVGISFRGCQPPEGMGPGIQITCRDYLLSDENEELGYGLSSYVLIKREPRDSLERNRYLALWRVYRGTFRKYAEYRNYEMVKEHANIAYWLLRVSSRDAIPNEDRKENEMFFVDNYDYARANVILTRIPDLNTPGPYIIAYHYPLGNLMPQMPDKKEILIMDLSRIDDRLFADILALFERKVKDDPKTWQRGFDWDLIRIHFHSALEVHGEPILYAAEWVGRFFGGLKPAFAAP